MIDSDESKYTVTVTKVGRASLEHGIEAVSGKVGGTGHTGMVDITCNCKFFVHYRMHCVHMFAAFNTYQLRTAQWIKPHDRWTKRYNWENYSKLDLGLMPINFEQESHLKELERKDFMRLNGLDDGGGELGDSSSSQAQSQIGRPVLWAGIGGGLDLSSFNSLDGGTDFKIDLCENSSLQEQLNPEEPQHRSEPTF